MKHRSIIIAGIGVIFSIMFVGKQQADRLERFAVGDAFPSRHKGLAGKLMEIAFKIRDPKEFPNIMQAIIAQYKDNKYGYVRLITRTHDKDGWNILHHLVADNDQKNIELFLESTDTVLHGDSRSWAPILNDVDNQKRTAFNLAVIEYRTTVMHQLLDKATDVLQDEDFLRFLNASEKRQRRTALMQAALEDQFETVQAIIEAAKKVFGCNSELFKEVINAQDVDGHTALTLGTMREIEDYLKSYGAVGEYFVTD